MVAVGCSIVDYKERERTDRDETGMCVHAYAYMCMCALLYLHYTQQQQHTISHIAHHTPAPHLMTVVCVSPNWVVSRTSAMTTWVMIAIPM